MALAQSWTRRDLCGLDVVHDLVELDFAHNGALLYARVQGVAHLAVAGQFRCLLHKLIVDVCTAKTYFSLHQPPICPGLRRSPCSLLKEEQLLVSLFGGP